MSSLAEIELRPDQLQAFYADRLGQSFKPNGRGEAVARCRFHSDRNPSFSVNLNNGLWFCHAGCGGGSIFDFEMRLANCTFPEARRRILESVGAIVMHERQLIENYSYTDEQNVPLFEVLRYEQISPDGDRLKEFLQRRPDGRGGWIWNLDGVRRVLYRLPEVIAAESVLDVEGEKDVEAARKLGFTATCNSGGAGKWRDEYSETLRGKHVPIIADRDEPGRKHAQQVATSLQGKAATVKVLELPSAKDLSEWVEHSGTREALLELIRNAPEWKLEAVPSANKGNPANPWSLAASMDAFLGDEEVPAKFLFAPVIAKEAVTEIFSPRGLGKSLWALFVAVFLALANYKVLLIDRDNPRRVVRERLRFFGATSDLTTLKVLSRENAPPLTNTRAWAEFPYYEYDLVILDSLDSAAEGVGEQDSSKPSLAIAPLLDIARRENGPAVLLLGNTIKSAKHSRGSGVIEDRADIVFEVRDATNFHPTGKKPWIEELPAADAGSWAGRSTRRKRLSKYRLAFIATKYRIGEEPEPFIIEIDLTNEPWTVRDVTDDVDREGAAVRSRSAKEQALAVKTATDSLKEEILRREESGEPVMLKKQAEEFLASRGNTRKAARQVIDSRAFETVKIVGKGHPKCVRVADNNANVGGNETSTEPAPDKTFSNGEFGRPHPEGAAEMPSDNSQYQGGSKGSPISPEGTEIDANDEEIIL